MLEATATALAIWERTNLANLEDNILPTRPRATLILTKGAAMTFDKRLPVASGIGGGSAAAHLRRCSRRPMAGTMWPPNTRSHHLQIHGDILIAVTEMDLAKKRTSGDTGLQ